MPGRRFRRPDGFSAAAGLAAVSGLAGALALAGAGLAGAAAGLAVGVLAAGLGVGTGTAGAAGAAAGLGWAFGSGGGSFVGKPIVVEVFRRRDAGKRPLRSPPVRSAAAGLAPGVLSTEAAPSSGGLTTGAAEGSRSLGSVAGLLVRARRLAATAGFAGWPAADFAAGVRFAGAQRRPRGPPPRRRTRSSTLGLVGRKNVLLDELLGDGGRRNRRCGRATACGGFPTGGETSFSRCKAANNCSVDIMALSVTDAADERSSRGGPGEYRPRRTPSAPPRRRWLRLTYRSVPTPPSRTRCVWRGSRSGCLIWRLPGRRRATFPGPPAGPRFGRQEVQDHPPLALDAGKLVELLVGPHQITALPRKEETLFRVGRPGAKVGLELRQSEGIDDLVVGHEQAQLDAEEIELPGVRFQRVALGQLQVPIVTGRQDRPAAGRGRHGRPARRTQGLLQRRFCQGLLLAPTAATTPANC